MRHRRSSKVVSVVTTVALVGVLVAVGVYVYHEQHEQQADVEALDEARSAIIEPTAPAVVEAATNVDDDIDTALLRQIDFGYLTGVNDDVSSWLFVPNTGIDEVIMQEPVLGQYRYDMRDWRGRSNSSGTFLFPAEPDGAHGESVDDAHTLVLGHRMINWRGGDWQFSGLPTRWATRAGAEQYPAVYTYKADHSTKWRIWAAADVWASDEIYDEPYTLGSEKYQALLAHVGDVAHYTIGAAPSADERTLVLSTCNRANGGALRRFVLVCVPEAEWYYDTHTFVDKSDELAYAAWVQARADKTAAATSDVVVGNNAADVDADTADSDLAKTTTEGASS